MPSPLWRGQPASDPATVLVAEDERDLAALYEAWLAETYDVRVAHDGATAVGRFDEAVDVVLLDRRMPGDSGDEVLAHVREAGTGAGVAMVTAVEPTTDVASMGFDEYVVKPVDQGELLSLVATLLRRAEYDDAVRRHYRVASKLALLERHRSRGELADSDEYERLRAELDAIDGELSGEPEPSPEDVGAMLRAADDEQ